MKKDPTIQQIFRNRIGIGVLNLVFALLSFVFFYRMGADDLGIAAAVFLVPVAFAIAGALAIYVAIAGRCMDDWQNVK